jgi:hypothetical protein
MVLEKWARAAVAGGKCIREIGIDAAALLIVLCARAAIPGDQLRESDVRAERGFSSLYLERPEGDSFRVYTHYPAESQNPHVFFASRVITFSVSARLAGFHRGLAHSATAA